MLDFTAYRAGQQTFAELTAGLTVQDLRIFTNRMIATQLGIIYDATDADIVFVPNDPQAKDTFGTPEEADLAWTLGHVVLHATASSEESAALAATLARGIVVEGRSRYEPDWRTLTTARQARRRLEESQRMRLAFLDAWPDEPHLDVTYAPYSRLGPINAVQRFIFGLQHDTDHLEQMREIMRQARAARR